MCAKDFHGSLLMHLQEHGWGMVLRAMVRRGIVTKIITMESMIMPANPAKITRMVVIAPSAS